MGHNPKTITQHYDKAKVQVIAETWNKVDLGDADWVVWALEKDFHLVRNPLHYDRGPWSGDVDHRRDNSAIPEVLERMRENLEKVKGQDPRGMEASWQAQIESVRLQLKSLMEQVGLKV